MTPGHDAGIAARLFTARSVAVVGASDDEKKVGFRPVDYLVRYGFAGPIYPVNPRLRRCRGLPCFPSLSDLPEVPDLVTIVVAADKVGAILEEAGRLGVGAAVVISSGFAEIGDQGLQIESELAAIAGRYDIALCGPNSVGYIHAPSRLVPTFTEALTRGALARSGGVAVVSQSGAFGTVIYGLARDMDVGLRTYVSTGNEAFLGVTDFLSALVEDPEVGAIGGYVETIRNGAAFARVAARARELQKPIVLVKVGTTDAGAIAAASHTGALAGDDRVYDAAFRRFGVERADDERHLLDVLAAFDTMQRYPQGPRLAVVSTSGGAGVLLADQLVGRGLEIAAFSAGLKERLRERLPPFAAVGNPVDLTGRFVADSAGMHSVLEQIVSEPGVDGVILFAGLAWSAQGAWVDAVAEAGSVGAPIVAVAPLHDSGQRERLRVAGIPVYESPHQAVRVVHSLVRWVNWRAPEPAAPILSPWPVDPGRVGEFETKQLLGAVGITVPRGEIAITSEEADRIARDLGSRVVLKVRANGLAHKTEVGGVVVDVAPEAAGDAYGRLVDGVSSVAPSALLDGVLVEEMIPGNVEMIIGATYVEPFGHLLLVGLGGVNVELHEDLVFDLAPVGPRDARALLKSLRSAPLLDGYRGAEVLDLDALAETISVVSRLVAGIGPRLRELDLNPVAVLAAGRGVAVLDAFAVIGEAGERSAESGVRHSGG